MTQYTPYRDEYQCDDLTPAEFMGYCFEKVLQWLNSCSEPWQMKAAENCVRLFRRKYPAEKRLSQNLYRKYWQIKRELNQLQNI